MVKGKDVAIIGGLIGSIIALGVLIVKARKPPPPTGNLHVRVNYPEYGTTNSVYPPGDYNVSIGTTVIIEAVPSEGYSFFNWTWSGDIEPTIIGLTFSFVMPATEVTVQANFQ